mgnify:FL=1
MVPKWKLVEGYTQNHLFKDFIDKVFTLEEFIEKGDELYDLKDSTCTQKLERGVREGLVVQIDKNKYKTTQNLNYFN